MGLRRRFSLILTVVFLVGFLIAGAVSYFTLQRQAREEVAAKVELLMSAARAVRAYTVEEVRPRLKSDPGGDFVPQTVPAYAAVAALSRLPEAYKSYSYREAALNPTNPKDKAVSWEADVINQFRGDAKLTRLVGERAANAIPTLYIARPIRITNKACLACHSDPDIAPISLIKTYGAENGFGWKHNEVVAAQIGSVPMSVAIDRAHEAFAVFMGLLAAVFVTLFVVLNFMLSRYIVEPIKQMAANADKVSTGDFDVDEFPEEQATEVGRLGLSFNRMRRSLEKAMKMIGD